MPMWYKWSHLAIDLNTWLGSSNFIVNWGYQYNQLNQSSTQIANTQIEATLEKEFKSLKIKNTAVETSLAVVREKIHCWD
jgi:hypothetical protein